MKYCILISAMIVVTYSCNIKSKQNKQLKSTSEIVSKSISMESMEDCPISKPLKEYLNNFQLKVDSMPNPYNKSIVYLILFSRENSDSIIELVADITAMKIKEESRGDYELKGLCFSNNKPVIIYDFIKSKYGNQFYNEKALSKGTVKNYILLPDSGLQDAWTFVPPKWKLKIISADSIQIIENTISGTYDFY